MEVKKYHRRMMKDEEGLFCFFFSSVPCVFRILEPYLPF